MRIAFLLPSLAKTAPMIIVASIIKHLKKEYDSIEVFYFKGEIEIEMGVPVHQLDFSVPFTFESFDLLHTHLFKPNMYVMRFRNQIKCKTITTIHSYIRQDIYNTYRFPINFIATSIWYRALAKHDALVCLTQSMMRFYQSHIPTKKIYVVNNGIECHAIHEPLGSDDQQELVAIKKKYKVIGSTSSLTPLKGLEIMIPFLEQNKNYFWFAIGSGRSLKNLQKYALKAGVLDRCKFTGFKKNSAAFYSQFDIFAFPSRSEGFGLSMAEAALRKCAIVCSDIEVFRELFTEDEVAFFKLDDVRSFCKAVRKLELAPEKFGTHAYTKLQEKYTAPVMADAYLDVYKRTLQ